MKNALIGVSVLQTTSKLQKKKKYSKNFPVSISINVKPAE